MALASLIQLSGKDDLVDFDAMGEEMYGKDYYQLKDHWKPIINKSIRRKYNERIDAYVATIYNIMVYY